MFERSVGRVMHAVDRRITSMLFAQVGDVYKALCVGLMIPLFLSCSRDRAHRKREGSTVGDIRRLSYEWKAARIRELYPRAEVLDEWERDLIEGIKKNGIDWGSDGEVVAFQDIIKRVGERWSKGLRSVDAWGRAYEFRVVDGFLAVRSSGADRVFDNSVYYYGSFPWLSGGDLVIVGGEEIRWTVPPKAPDWLEDGVWASPPIGVADLAHMMAGRCLLPKYRGGTGRRPRPHLPAAGDRASMRYRNGRGHGGRLSQRRSSHTRLRRPSLYSHRRNQVGNRQLSRLLRQQAARQLHTQRCMPRHR